MADMSYRPLRNERCRITDDISFKGYRSLLMENEKLLIHLLLDKGAEPIRWLHSLQILILYGYRHRAYIALTD